MPPYQPPTPVQGPDFLQQFMAGFHMMQQRKEAEREQRRQELFAHQQQLDNELRREHLKMEKAKLSAAEREAGIHEKLQGRQVIEQNLRLLEQSSAPVEQMTPGLQGPPAEAPNAHAPMAVPGIPELGVEGVQVAPRYREDVLQEKRQEQDMARQGAVDQRVAFNKADEPFDVAKDERALKQAKILQALRDAGGGAGDVGLTLSSPALDMAAKRYLADGTLPPHGHG